MEIGMDDVAALTLENWVQRREIARLQAELADLRRQHAARPVAVDSTGGADG